MKMSLIAKLYQSVIRLPVSEVVLSLAVVTVVFLEVVTVRSLVTCSPDGPENLSSNIKQNPSVLA